MNHFYVLKIKSKKFSKTLIRNFATDMKRVTYILTTNNKGGGGNVEWGNNKLKFSFKDENYLFLFTNKSEDIRLVEKLWQVMCNDRDLAFIKQVIPKGIFIGEHFSQDIMDFEFIDDELKADLAIGNEEITVLYDANGCVTFTMSINLNVPERVMKFTMDFLQKVDKLSGD